MKAARFNLLDGIIASIFAKKPVGAFARGWRPPRRYPYSSKRQMGRTDGGNRYAFQMGERQPNPLHWAGKRWPWNGARV